MLVASPAGPPPIIAMSYVLMPGSLLECQSERSTIRVCSHSEPLGTHPRDPQRPSQYWSGSRTGLRLLQNALFAIGILDLFGFVMSCFLPGGKTKKPAAEPEAKAE